MACMLSLIPPLVPTPGGLFPFSASLHAYHSVFLCCCRWGDEFSLVKHPQVSKWEIILISFNFSSLNWPHRGLLSDYPDHETELPFMPWWKCCAQNSLFWDLYSITKTRYMMIIRPIRLFSLIETSHFWIQMFVFECFFKVSLNHLSLQGTEVKAITYSAMQVHDIDKPEIFAIIDIWGFSTEELSPKGTWLSEHACVNGHWIKGNSIGFDHELVNCDVFPVMKQTWS